jgi:hypothetical protein
LRSGESGMARRRGLSAIPTIPEFRARATTMRAREASYGMTQTEHLFGCVLLPGQNHPTTGRVDNLKLR